MKQFQAESKRLLDLMINSIYTHKEIFLRELISNASDAIDKLLYLALTDPSVGMRREDFKILLSIDKEARTLTISDNGIGMSAGELEKNLGTIAFSGTKEFSETMPEEAAKGEESGNVDLIGQFGVGFYSAFMVADRVTVVSRKYGEAEAHKWESDGAEGFTVSDAERAEAGTDVILHIREDRKKDGESAENTDRAKESTPENGQDDAREESPDADEYGRYLREYPIYKLVKRYSDYIRYPIQMMMPHPEIKEGTGITKEDGTKVEPEFEEKWALETFNSMVPLWHRKKDEVKQEEYNEFYTKTFDDPEAPQRVIQVSVEGAITYDALLFIPTKVPGLYGSDEYKAGLQLYSSGVLIMERCEELLPDYFNFVRGVVDSPDLSLNISREMLQHDRQLHAIRAHLEKKIRAELEKMLTSEREEYEKFFANFGRPLKISLLDSYGENKEQIQDLLLFYSNQEKKLVQLKEYVSRMKPEQKYIYYAGGENIEAIDRLPQTEVLKDRSMEILYFTDRLDEFVAEMMKSYGEKHFRSALDKDLDLGEEKPDESGLYRDTLDFIKKALGDKVDEVRASNKLISHPVCMSSGDGITFEMERYFKAVGQEMPVKAKRILELNVDHKAFRAIDNTRLINPEKAEKYAYILYTQAMMIAGMPIDDPSEYTDILTSLW